VLLLGFDKKLVVAMMVLMFAGIIAFSQVSYALDPPTKQQINNYKKDELTMQGLQMPPILEIANLILF